MCIIFSYDDAAYLCKAEDGKFYYAMRQENATKFEDDEAAYKVAKEKGLTNYRLIPYNGN